MKRWSHLAFARFEALSFLDECENILYLDFDILLLKSVKELFALKNKGFALAADKSKHSLNSHISSYQGVFKDAMAWRTGTILFNDNLKNPAAFYEFVYAKLAQGAEFIDDQALFSLYVLENKIKIKNLNKDKYVGQVCLKASLKSSIIHAYGKTQRFWNNALCNHTWQDWQVYYQKWLKLGGSAYTQGICANTTYSIQRIRNHLAYKLGYMVMTHAKGFESLKLLYLLPLTYARHLLQNKAYFKLLKKRPELKMPPLASYDDYALGIKEKQSVPYQLGSALILAYQTWHKGGLLRLFKEISRIKKAAKNVN